MVRTPVSRVVLFRFVWWVVLLVRMVPVCFIQVGLPWSRANLVRFRGPEWQEEALFEGTSLLAAAMGLATQEVIPSSRPLFSGVTLG